MSVFEAIKNRRSIRKYKTTKIEEEKLGKILEAARIAPSAANRQEWKFIIVRDQEKRAELADAVHGQKFVEQAPVTIVACSTESERIMPCGQHAYAVDLSIAVSFMILEATELGLGTCWLGAFNENEVKKILDMPEEIRVAAMFTVGYVDEDTAPRARKELNKIVCYERYEL